MIETKRLQLVNFSVEDAAFVLDLLNSSTWLEFIGDRGVRTLDDARLYIQNGPLKSYEQFGFGPYLVRQKENGRPVGLCGLFKRETLPDVDIGFAVLPAYAGRGYGYESATAVITYATNRLGLARLTGLTTADNTPSIQLLEKLGLRFEKKIRFRDDGKESLLYGMPLRTD
ncbi:GNAT family N-acetyltransferase [Spirosoma koreense]